MLTPMDTTFIHITYAEWGIRMTKATFMGMWRTLAFLLAIILCMSSGCAKPAPIITMGVKSNLITVHNYRRNIGHSWYLEAWTDGAWFEPAGEINVTFRLTPFLGFK